jgi:alpha-galactosidase
VPITISDDGRLFSLTTRATSYAFAVDDQGLLRHLHWGPRIDRPADYDVPQKWDLSTNDMLSDIMPEEYPFHGQFRYKEQCLAVTFADRTREIRAHVKGSVVDGDQLIVTLRDDHTGLEIDLGYRVLHRLDLIERWATIRNTSTSAFTIDSAFSAQFHVPYEGLTFRNVHGMWAAEQQRFAQPVAQAKVVVEARHGISTHNHNPYFILDRGATEDAGQVWFGALQLSGNFRGVVEQSTYGGTSVQFGINPYDFSAEIPPGAQFQTPVIVAGYVADGLAQMSLRLHSYGRSLMTAGERPVLYNSWEATGFDVNLAGQVELARKAQRIGVELFVIDDGWFGRRGEDEDGLGDWWVNPVKFPDGLQPLIDEVHDLGMDFGLWVEPEMVNPRADLFRDHPDWIYREPDREPDTARQQYVLNLCLPQVQEYVFRVVDELLSTYDIDYLKWDANRPISHVGALRDPWYGHIRALYEIVARLKAEHPGVMIESCASGGGRIDFGALSVFDDFWTSDNTDAWDRLTIQRGYSLVYPSKAMRAWVTDSPNFLTQRRIPLQFRFHVAMMGSLGIGADLTTFSEEELAQCEALVEQYKQIRPVVQDGDWYRLDNPSPNDYQAHQYVHDGSAVLFLFLPFSRIGRRGTRLRMRGLDPAATYRFTWDWKTVEKTGQYLMEHGLDAWLMGEYASSITTFETVTG